MTINIAGVVLLLILLSIAMAYLAARKRRSPVLWGLLAFVPALNIVFLIALAVMPTRSVPGQSGD